ncbi:glycoside hydrolase family 92 protein [Hymenobacter qilianensis]|uniref:Glycoside hydrolase family 92 protein n=1 Tax=Hymenobacter qilianensis TaxID=1385715 RepID=A0A7H0H0Q4_9BACT|nr:glycoside hydrolase family 92 protein [Hymenobacter qilianensis]
MSIKSQSGKKYVKEARLNGQKLKRPFLAHQNIVKGGELVFLMAARP